MRFVKSTSPSPTSPSVDRPWGRGLDRGSARIGSASPPGPRLSAIGTVLEAMARRSEDTLRATSRGAELELVPTAMVAGGRALARDPDGRVVFVAGALPGERVRVVVETERRSYVTARLVEVLVPSAERVAPPCPELANGCGACQWQHVEAGAAAVVEGRHRARRAQAHRRSRGRARTTNGRATGVVVSHDGSGRSHQWSRGFPRRSFA